MPSSLSARRNVVSTAVVALLAGTFLLGGASAAQAESPVDFGSSDIVDTVGVLGSETTSVQSALDELQQDTGTTLLVAFIDSPSDPDDLEAWTREVVSRNGLGTGNALLIVAVDDRQYRFDVDGALSVTDDQLDTIQSEDIVPALGSGRWADAAIGAANGLAEAQGASLSGGDGGGSSDSGGSDSDSGSSGAGFNFVPTVLILGGFALVLVLVALFLSRRRSRARRQRQAAEKDLEVRAGGLLVDLDNAVTTSDQELGFAIAEFGDDQVGPFREALAAAREDLRAAFRIRQQLDDVTPDSPEQRTAWLQQIIELCTRADAALDAQADAFDDLRALARNAPTALAAAERAAATVDERLGASEREVAALTNDYDSAALAEVRDNAAQARSLLAFAAGRRAEAQSAIDANRGSDAAVAVREAEQAAAQASTLLDAVDASRARLEEAASKLPSAQASLSSDIVEARALTPAQHDLIAGDIAAAIRDAEAAVSQAGATRDPVAALTALTSREAALDALLAPVREIAERRRRAEEALARSMVTALGQVRSAEDFVTTRRGRVGDAARARLSEAKRHLEQAEAIRATDPEAALAEAGAASSLAASASTLARSDADDDWSGGGYGGGSRGGRSGGDMDDVAGAVIGGIIGGLLSGGGSRGGFGGSGGFGGGGFGGFGGGGFGGSGGGRRGGGRSFGGSGRRGGGGRF